MNLGDDNDDDDSDYCLSEEDEDDEEEDGWDDVPVNMDPADEFATPLHLPSVNVTGI